MLDIKWAMEKFGLKEEKFAIKLLENLDKFNYGCFSCGSESDLVYTEMGEVLCKNCRENFCIDDEGFIDDSELEEVVKLAWQEEIEDDED